MEEKFAHIYQHAVRVASALNVQPSMPRAVGRQTNRDNAPATNPEEYYGRNVAMPLINHINVQLDGQFSGNELKSKTVVSLSKILHIADCSGFCDKRSSNINVSFFKSLIHVGFKGCQLLFFSYKQICLYWHLVFLVWCLQSCVREIFRTWMTSSRHTKMIFRPLSY